MVRASIPTFSNIEQNTIQEIDKVSIIKEILLNKVSGLHWYYFTLDLNKDFNEINSDTEIYSDDDSFFENFEVKNNQYTLKDGNKLKKEASSLFKNIFTIADRNPEIFKEIAQRIFDKKEIPNKSDADQGLLGKYNEKDRAYRNGLFFEKIKSGFRDSPKKKVILAEGDSWFQFPRIFLGLDAVKDIIDHLIEDKNYAINSLAYGGDWLSNILSLGEYVEELTLLSPDVFLISGGGNDMVGSSRLATMVKNPFFQNKEEIADEIEKNRFLKELFELRKKQASQDNFIKDRKIFVEEKYQKGLVYIQDEFFQFINIVMVQYYLFMYNILKSGKYDNMKIITQGYDFAVPRKDKEPKKNIYNKAINKANQNGKWLDIPLKMKGIIDDETQEAIVYVMIYEFNEMLIQLANFKHFKNVYHIDNRGIAKYEDGDWFDELHLQSRVFKKVAALYKQCIDKPYSEENKHKVYTTLDLNNNGK